MFKNNSRGIIVRVSPPPSTSGATPPIISFSHGGPNDEISLSDIQAKIKKNEEQLAKLKRQPEDFRDRERTGVIEELSRKIAKYGLTAADLKLSGRAAPKARAARSSAELKYRGPNGEAWAGGVGRRPTWVKKAFATGKSLSEYEIK